MRAEYSTIQPITERNRNAVIDVLRGWALLGVVLMNYVDYYYLGINFSVFKPDSFTDLLVTTSNIIFSAKSWALLSFLFGFGFAVLIEKVNAKGINTYTFFSRRMFWLLVLGLINSLFFFGDILKDYAVTGMLLLLFSRASAKTAFFTALFLLHYVLNPAGSTLVSSWETDSICSQLILTFLMNGTFLP